MIIRNTSDKILTVEGYTFLPNSEESFDDDYIASLYISMCEHLKEVTNSDVDSGSVEESLEDTSPSTPIAKRTKTQRPKKKAARKSKVSAKRG